MQEGTLLRNLRELATLWLYTGVSNSFGKKIYVGPIANVRCRWEDREERYLNEQGVEEVSRATVFIDRDFLPGSRILLGASLASDPEPVLGTFVVKALHSTPSLHNPLVKERRALL